MIEFHMDIKTRLLKQASELGITSETAAMLAACIDATIADYSGETVYFGKSEAIRQQLSQRNRSIIRDWRAGERASLLSRRYGISRMQIYRIVNGV